MNDRVRWLDVVRGVAILGILPANVVYFIWPVSVSHLPDWYTGGATRERMAFLVVRALFDYKFITLFALLFGAGIVLLRMRVEAGGGSFTRVALRRFAILALIGIAHVALVWYGDILLHYASIALVLCWASAWQPRTLKWIGGILIALPALAMLVFLPIAAWIGDHPEVADAFGAEPGESFVPGSTTGTWDEFAGAFFHWGPGLELEVRIEGDPLRRMILRWVHWTIGTLSMAVYFGWRVIGLFLLGMAWAKDGTFTAWRDRLSGYRRALLIGLLVGVPFQIAACVLVFGDRLVAWVGAELCQYVGSLGLSAAYLAGIVLLLHRRPEDRRVGRVEAIGRTALSNYLLQSVLCTAVVAALGLYAAVDRATIGILVVAVWALQLAVSRPWIERFGTGPVERAWRRWADGPRPAAEPVIARPAPPEPAASAE